MSEQKLLKQAGSPGAYVLLKSYQEEANMLSIAYKMNELYYRDISKILTYPVIFLSAIASVLAGLRNPNLEYVLLGITLATLLFSGFNQAINPSNKQHLSNRCSTEFAEIASSTNQWIIENNKTKEEIKAYSRKMLAVLDVWKGISPDISNSLIQKAKLNSAVRVPRTSLSNENLKQKKTTVNGANGVVVDVDTL
jgi:hypothetical protein